MRRFAVCFSGVEEHPAVRPMAAIAEPRTVYLKSEATEKGHIIVVDLYI